MERLTVKIDNETYIPRALCGIGRDGEVDDYDGCAEYCEDGCEGECSQCGIQHCFNRLAAYENLQDKLDMQFDGCIELGEVIDALIEYDKQIQRDEKLAEAMLITNDSVRRFRNWKDFDEQGKLFIQAYEIYEVPKCRNCGQMEKGVREVIIQPRLLDDIKFYITEDDAIAALEELKSEID